jgi:hypothetical protein
VARFSKIKVIEYKICVLFSLSICLKYFSILEVLSELLSRMFIGTHIKRTHIKSTHIKGNHCSCQILKKLEFCLHIFEKYSNVKYHKYQSSGSGNVLCGRKDRLDKANSRYSKFCECA